MSIYAHLKYMPHIVLYNVLLSKRVVLNMFNSCSCIILAILILLLCLCCDNNISCIMVLLALAFAASLAPCFNQRRFTNSAAPTIA
jgi:hypothetical protein